MSKIDTYRQTLRTLDDWEPYLLAESGLPGPRGNIELAQAVADEGDEPCFLHLLAFDATIAPTNTPEEFLAFCGVVGLGRLVAEGRRDLLPALRRHDNDPRWRMREGVAMALQRWGRVDMHGLLAEMDTWSRGALLEQRAAAAALCEPALLGMRPTQSAPFRSWTPSRQEWSKLKTATAMPSKPYARASLIAGASPSPQTLRLENP